VGEGDLSGVEWGVGEGVCIRDSWGMNTSTTQEKVSARRDNRKGGGVVSSRCAKSRKQALGLRMTKKQEDNTTTDLYSPGVRLDAWADQWKLSQPSTTALGFVKRASREIWSVDLVQFHIPF
jgi:hypothetical protein